MREKHFIDTHKGATVLFVAALITWQDAWANPTALVYLALHGSYGLLWVTKSQVFPDRSWEKPCTLTRGLVIWLALSLYWLAPWIIVRYGVQAPAWLLAACVALYAAGVFLHFSADMHKHIQLALRPGQLIDSGLWSRLRNPNYFGELLIYLSFALLSMHWLPPAILALFVLAYWLPNMRRKDRSLSRHEGFADYRARSWLFIPLVY